jgi:hypothetical protein
MDIMAVWKLLIYLSQSLCQDEEQFKGELEHLKIGDRNFVQSRLP